MIKQIIHIIFILFLSIAFSQKSIELVDGKILETKNSIYQNPNVTNETAANDYIGVYQKYISGIRGQECPMYPSCSNFGLKVFKEKDFLSSIIITSDRLIRCGHDHKNYSLSLRDNGFKYIDYPSYDNPPKELFYKKTKNHYAYSDTIKVDSSLLFINKLINNQYYQEALLEIMRIEFKKNTFDLNLFINKVICLKALGEYEKALFEYEVKCPENYKKNHELILHIITIQYKLQNFDTALQINSEVLKECNDLNYKPKFIMLIGLLYANKYDWQSSINSFKSLTKYESYENISSLNYEIAEKGLTIKTKNTVKAGLLSIIPGLGYAYTGHKQTAISAFIINGMLAYATYNSFKKENYGMGILTGVFNFSFYISNIYGASKAAKRFNEKQKKNIINKLEHNINL